MKQKRILIPTCGILSWKKLLAEPEKQWKPGYSAKSIALSWENAIDIPGEIKSLFSNSQLLGFTNIKLALAIPEYKVSLPGGNRPSQNDVFALLSSDEGLSAMTVEGKAREDFDVTIEEWKQRTSDKGVRERLSFLTNTIGLTSGVPNTIRYQLLHRMASAVLEANRFHSKDAIMVIQSFIEDDRYNHYSDFQEFVKCFGKVPEKNSLIHLNKINNRDLYAAWVYSSY